MATYKKKKPRRLFALALFTSMRPSTTPSSPSPTKRVTRLLGKAPVPSVTKAAAKQLPYAAQLAAERASERAAKMGLKEAEVRVRGPGGGRESAIRALIGSGINVRAIVDVTPLPHNGCRPRKKRRV